MILYTLWIKRTYSDAEGLAPEMVAAWDEFSVDENYEGWKAACDAALNSLGSDLQEYRVIKVALADKAIDIAFASTVTPGAVV